MVGDGTHDIECAHAAKAVSCFLVSPTWSTRHEQIIDQLEPNFIITDLLHVLDIVENFEQK